MHISNNFQNKSSGKPLEKLTFNLNPGEYPARQGNHLDVGIGLVENRNVSNMAGSTQGCAKSSEAVGSSPHFLTEKLCDFRHPTQVQSSHFHLFHWKPCSHWVREMKCNAPYMPATHILFQLTQQPTTNLTNNGEQQ